jgi:CubicO group peptidase (beta-lactamase class C family)
MSSWWAVEVSRSIADAMAWLKMLSVWLKARGRRQAVLPSVLCDEERVEMLTTTTTTAAVAASHLSRAVDGSMGQSAVALPDVDAAHLGRVRALLQADIERGACDGVTLRATVNGAPLLAETVGYAERDTCRPLTADTVLAQFSVSKQFGAVLALMFIERGLLRLHTPVAEVIPEFGCLGKQSINLHHVLTQTTGLPPDVPVPALPMQAWLDNAMVVQHVCRLKPLATPGTRVSYQGFFGHALIAEMLHRLDPAGRTYVELVEQELLTPLGMTDTAMGLTRPDLIERFAPVVPRFTEPDLFEPPEHTGMNDLLRAGAVVPGGG